ncbi:MAG: hypothetical protein V4858_18765 [Pseudomonadota bacterium]
MYKLGKKERGQGMTEYIIIVAMIAVAAIAVYQYFGQTVRSQTAGMAQELAGAPSNTGQAAAAGYAGQAATTASTKMTLETYKDQKTK